MEVLGQLGGGFATALHPINLAFLLVGVVLGLVIGVLPGLGGTSGARVPFCHIARRPHRGTERCHPNPLPLPE